MVPMADANDVADWMASEVEVEGFLYRDSAVAHIADEFGDEFVYKDESGNPEIAEAVLTAFYKLTQGTVYWDRWDKCWRQRQTDDAPGLSLD
jgi:hypothetical protein